MQVLEERSRMGVVERRFVVDGPDGPVPAVLWSPEAPAGPTALVLLGHGGTQHKRTPNILGLARRFVRHLGYSCLALDAPEHGERIADPAAAEEARRRLESRVTRDGGAGSAPIAPSDELDALWAERNALAAAEWRRGLDAVAAEPGLVDDRVGYWGVSMGTVIGLALLAEEPRVRAAVLGLAGLEGWPDAARREAAARAVTIPVLFVCQWDDQLMARESCLGLFDALGSEDKTLHAFPGGHVATPLHERDAYDAFFARALGAAG